MPERLFAVARRGDPGAFAQLIEHWDQHLRPFVHHILGGAGSTDRVLAAAYLRAYRALPRYPSGRRPGLWLHRMAYLAADDELRRLRRDPRRRQPRTGEVPEIAPEPDVPPVGWTPDSTPLERSLRAALAPGTRQLAPDQRALVVMVDLEDFGVEEVADAFESEAAVVRERLRSARRILVASTAHLDLPIEADLDVDPAALGTAVADAEPSSNSGWRRGRTDGGPHEPTDRGGPSTDPFAIPAWARDAAPAPRPVAPSERPGTGDDDIDLAESHRGEDAHHSAVVQLLLSAAVVPEPRPGFWPELGRRLIAERDRPAAPTPDPSARLARAHPAEPGFRPTKGDDAGSISSMATRAERNRARRLRRPAFIGAAVLVVAGAVAGAVWLGTSTRTPDGSVSATELDRAMREGLTSSRHLRTQVEVDEPDVDGELVAATYQVTLSEDGSWAVARGGALDDVTYDGTAGTTERVVVVAATDREEPRILATEETGLATGAPDPTVTPVALLADLQAVGSVLRDADQTRAAATRRGQDATWTLRHTVPTGEAGRAEEWRVEVRQADGLPLRVERHAGTDRVRRIELSDWEPLSELPNGAFRQTIPDGAESTSTEHGFTSTELDAVGTLGRGPAVTPTWLPDGFELTTVAIRREPPDGGEPTVEGNPPDLDVASLGYQRGLERITVTTRAATTGPEEWSDPFGEPDRPGGGPVESQAVSAGRFNGARASTRSDAVGRAQLWGVDEDTVFTVSGDLSVAEALRVVGSLR